MAGGAGSLLKRWWPAVLLLSLIGLGVGRFLLLRYEPIIRSQSPGCPFVRHTGLYCSGCGGTRAFFALLKGDLLASFYLNPILLTGLVMAAVYGFARLIELRTGKARLRFTARMGWVLFIGVLLFGVLRNIHHWPFTLLAPH